MSRITASLAAAMLVPLAIACEPAPNPIPEQPAGPLPAKQCAEARQGLEMLTGSGMFSYTSTGEATVDRETWLKMEAGYREQLGRTLAFHAACHAKEAPREQQYVIRDETGTPLAQQVVEISPDLSSLGG